MLTLITVAASCIMPVSAKTQTKVYSYGTGSERWIDTLEYPDRDTSIDDGVKDEDIAIVYGRDAMEFIKKPYLKDGEIMLPAKEFMEKFGFFLGYQDELPVPGRFAGWFGQVNGADMSVYADSDKAYYDDVPLELPTNTVLTEDGSDVYVPLYFFQYIYGIKLDIQGGRVNVTLELEKEEVVEEAEEIDIDAVLEGLDPKPLVTWEKMLEQGPSGTPGQDAVVTKIVDLENDKFDKVIELENNTKPAVSYDNQVYWPNEEKLETGDIIVLDGWVRTVYCADESGMGTTHFCVESNGDWTKALLTSDMQVGREWQYFRYVASSSYSREIGGTGLKIRVGYNYQYLQFADVNVRNYQKQVKLKDLTGSTGETEPEWTYRGQEDDAIWREEAFRRIEKYRKSPIKVEVKDEDGNPVEGADVRLNMTKNEFLFGSEIDTGYYGAAKATDLWWEMHSKYFNGFVVGNNSKPGGSKVSMAELLNYARKYNLSPKWHVIFYDGYGMVARNNTYGSYSEADLQNMDYDQFYDFYMRDIAGRIAMYADYMQEIELTNEVMDMRDAYSKYGWTVITDFMEAANELLGERPIKMINSTGEAGQPGGVNYGKTITNSNIMKELKERGVEFNSTGLQSHGGSGTSPVDMYLEVEQTGWYADYVGCTEYDYSTNDIGYGTEEGRHKQACHLRDTIIQWYSEPKATSFVMWGYTDFYHWKRFGPLADQQLVPKEEAEKYWLELVMDEWKPDLSEKTDENGEVNVRTHRGDFDVTVTVNGKSETVRLKSTKDGENLVQAVVKKDGSIEMTSSETYYTVAEATEPLYKSQIRTNNKNLDMTYLTLQENKAVSATTESGKDVSYLLESDNESTWVSGKSDSYVTLKLGEERRIGYVTMKWQDGTKNAYTVEVSEDGENWTKLAGSESTERDIVKFKYAESDSTRINYVRIGSADGSPIALKSAVVYPVEYYARTK